MGGASFGEKGDAGPSANLCKQTLNPRFYQGVLDQITNVASLPGILKYAICMPDGHLGYGFPIEGDSGLFEYGWGYLSRWYWF